MSSLEDPMDLEEEKEAPKKKQKRKNNELQERLRNLKIRQGIIGYILRTSRSASIDLKDPTKIIDYAVLSSTTLDAAADLSETFELGEIQNILLEGKDAKILLLKVEDQRLSIFMDRNVDHEKIYRDLGM